MKRHRGRDLRRRARKAGSRSGSAGKHGSPGCTGGCAKACRTRSGAGAAQRLARKADRGEGHTAPPPAGGIQPRRAGKAAARRAACAKSATSSPTTSRKERLALNNAELEEFVGTIVDEMIGLGPLEPLMRDPDDLRHPDQRPQELLRRDQGQACSRCMIPFKDEAHLLRIVNKIVAAVGRRIDESQPDVRRAHARRLALQRRHPPDRRSTDRWCRSASSPRTSFGCTSWSSSAPSTPANGRGAAPLRSHARMTTIISGGTGTGKTTMLNALVGFHSATTNA